MSGEPTRCDIGEWNKGRGRSPFLGRKLTLRVTLLMVTEGDLIPGPPDPSSMTLHLTILVLQKKKDNQAIKVRPS